MTAARYAVGERSLETGMDPTCPGLLEKRDDAGNDYAFAMNGYQQAAAMVPTVKYDKRFARAVSKWVLNLANASRFYYSKYLPSASQDDYTWSNANDPESVIGYEALKENLNGKRLYATGDAKTGGWAQTNLGIYGSSSIGYLAAVVDTTDVSGILRLDINKTDFFGQNAFPSYLIYNPYATTKTVTLPLGAQSYDIYDAMSETVIKTNVTGDVPIDIPADQVMMLVYMPAGSTPVNKNGKLYVGNVIIDYHSGYNFTSQLRVKALVSADSVVSFNGQATVVSTIDNPGGTLIYNWSVNDAPATSSVPGSFMWTAPAVAGKYKIRLQVTNGTTSAKDSIYIRVVDRIPAPPVVSAITADKKLYSTGELATISCAATNSFGGTLQYNWTITGGSVQSQTDGLLKWTLPTDEGLYTVTCEVTNSDNLKAPLLPGCLYGRQAPARLHRSRIILLMAMHTMQPATVMMAH